MMMMAGSSVVAGAAVGGAGGEEINLPPRDRVPRTGAHVLVGLAVAPVHGLLLLLGERFSSRAVVWGDEGEGAHGRGGEGGVKGQVPLTPFLASAPPSHAPF